MKLKALTPAVQADIETLWREGRSNREISAMLDVGLSTVHKYTRRLGPADQLNRNELLRGWK